MSNLTPLNGALPTNTDNEITCPGCPYADCQAAPYNRFSTFEMLNRMGIHIEYSASEVPLEMGLAAMWLAEDAIKQCKNLDFTHIEGQRRQRTFNRVASLLRKYGKVPEVALIKTDDITVSVNPVTAAHEGTVNNGPLHGRPLHEFSPDQIMSLRTKYQNPQTLELLDAWCNLSRAAEC